MNQGDVRAVLVIPTGLARDLEAGKTVPVQILLNGDNANTATTVMGYALTIVQSESQRYQLVAASAPLAPPVSVEPRVWYNPQLRSALFLVPGLIAYIVMITVGRLDGGLHRPREGARHDGAGAHGADQRLVVRAREDDSVFRDFAGVGNGHRAGRDGDVWVADARILGAAPADDVAVSGRRAGAGLLISSIAETQQVAFQMALLASFLPTLMLSGFIFPIASMPTFLRGVTYAVPARYFLIALRGIVLKGVGSPDRSGSSSRRCRSIRRSCWCWRRHGFAVSGVEMRRTGVLIWKELIELRRTRGCSAS